MTNPFTDKSPSELKALVLGKAICEYCKGLALEVQNPGWTCTMCASTGKQPPLPSADLEALAAEYCEDLIVETSHVRRCIKKDNIYVPWVDIPAYTTDPTAAMRLQEKYDMSIMQAWGEVIIPGKYISVKFGEKTTEVPCHAITTAALLAALTEAIERENL